MPKGQRKPKKAWKRRELLSNDVIIRRDEARDTDIVIPYVSIRHVSYHPRFTLALRVMGPTGVGKSTVGSSRPYKSPYQIRILVVH
jgi:hypothetical protein